MKRKQVLIVEDNQELASMFATILQANHLDTQIAGTGQQALTYLGESVPQLVLLDLQLPDTNGLTVLKHIRATSTFALTRVVIVTATPHVLIEGNDQADLVLIKPVTIDQLSNLVARLI